MQMTYGNIICRCEHGEWILLILSAQSQSFQREANPHSLQAAVVVNVKIIENDPTRSYSISGMAPRSVPFIRTCCRWCCDCRNNSLLSTVRLASAVVGVVVTENDEYFRPFYFLRATHLTDVCRYFTFRPRRTCVISTAKQVNTPLCVCLLRVGGVMRPNFHLHVCRKVTLKWIHFYDISLCSLLLVGCI